MPNYVHNRHSLIQFYSRHCSRILLSHLIKFCIIKIRDKKTNIKHIGKKLMKYSKQIDIPCPTYLNSSKILSWSIDPRIPGTHIFLALSDRQYYYWQTQISTSWLAWNYRKHCIVTTALYHWHSCIVYTNTFHYGSCHRHIVSYRVYCQAQPKLQL